MSTDIDRIKQINNQTRKNRKHNYFRNFATNKRDEWEEIPVKEIELVCRRKCKFETAFDVVKLMKKEQWSGLFL